MTTPVPIKQFIGDEWVFPCTVTDGQPVISGVSNLLGGTGYTSAPTVTFPAPTLSSGRQATGTATISGGAVTGVTMTDIGFGYDQTIPQPAAFSGGGGSGASALAVVGNTVNITGLTPGGEYYTIANLSVQATDLTVLNGRVSVINASRGQFVLTLESAITQQAIPQTASATSFPTRIQVFFTDTSGNRTTYGIIYILPTDPRSA